MPLVWERVDVELHGANDLAFELGDEQQAAALGDRVLDPPPVRVYLRGVERREEADGRPVLDGVDQNLAEPRAPDIQFSRVDGSDCGPVHAESSNIVVDGVGSNTRCSQAAGSHAPGSLRALQCRAAPRPPICDVSL